MAMKEVVKQREGMTSSRQTCDKSIPFGAPGGEAGCFECEATQLAELEHQAGSHLSLCENLPPHMHTKHNIKVTVVEHLEGFSQEC